MDVLECEVEEERAGGGLVRLNDVHGLAGKQVGRVLALPLPAHALVGPQVITRERVPVIRGRPAVVVLPTE